jgi:hypothetical protein
MSISSQIRGSEDNFKLAQKIVNTLSAKFSFSFDEAWAELSNRNVDNLTKMFRKERRRNDPLSQVKKPRTSFSFFTQEFRPKVQAANPTASFGDLSRLVSTEWKNITEKNRIRFKGMETADKERYQTERARVMAELASASTAETTTETVETPTPAPATPVKKSTSKRSGKSAKSTTPAETPAETPAATPAATPTKAKAVKKTSGAKRTRAPKATVQSVTV